MEYNKVNLLKENIRVGCACLAFDEDKNTTKTKQKKELKHLVCKNTIKFNYKRKQSQDCGNKFLQGLELNNFTNQQKYQHIKIMFPRSGALRIEIKGPSCFFNHRNYQVHCP